MNIIIKNTNVKFVTSKVLEKQSVQVGYMQDTGVIQPYATYSVTEYDVSNLHKVKIKGNIGNNNLPLVLVILEKNGAGAPIMTLETSTASYDTIIDVFDADILYVNSLTSDVDNVECQIIEFDTLDGQEIEGEIVANSILDDNGDIAPNQYYSVVKYNVADVNYINLYTTLNSTSDTAYCLKKNGATIGITYFDYSTRQRESFLVDVRGIDEVWICNLGVRYSSCNVVR